MPTYTYTCTECSDTFERVLRMDDNKLPESEACLNCGKKSIKQIISGSFRLTTPISLGRQKPPSWFNERLREIKKTHPKSDFNIRD
jgi:putative FmdB family regulatory protein